MVAVFSLPIFAYVSLFDSAIPPRVRIFRLVLTLGAGDVGQIGPDLLLRLEADSRGGRTTC